MTEELGRLRLERPIVVLDIEATGLDPAYERIVEIALIRVGPNGKRIPFRRLVDPGIPIPAEATRIHGIDDARVKGAPRFEEIAPDVLDHLSDADLVGFNHVRFDLPILREEFRRANVEWDWRSPRIVDVQAIYHRMEPRDLSAAVRFYCGRELTGAHGALADVEGTLDVFLAQLQRYPELPGGVEELDALFDRKDDRYVDRDRRFLWRDGEPAFAFGLHRGKLLRTVAEEDPDHLDWILRKDFSDEVKGIVTDALRGMIRRRG